VADEKSVNAMVSTVLGVSGRIDALVSNAGIFPRVPLRETTTERFDRIMAVNFRGGFLCAMAVLPEMEKVGGGSMVFLSSGAGTLAAIEQPLARSLPVYGASKAALDRWALGVAPELADAGIAVNVLYPGAVVRTRGTQGLSLSSDEMDAGIEPDEVAPAVVHLAAQRPGQAEAMVGKLVKAVEFGRTWG
jgi:NAD(P)-dependent dehydrogenase (short-subunit alcohol dehydrogenase family)